jgi:CelD/BcsL family acetyltransferase involved in cellulose biosynthesis
MVRIEPRRTGRELVFELAHDRMNELRLGIRFSGQGDVEADIDTLADMSLDQVERFGVTDLLAGDRTQIR